MSAYSELFKFSAKAGSLEGYLFKRKEVDSLANWVSNILSMYEQLSLQVRKDIKPDLLVVLNRVMEYGTQTVPSDLKQKIQMLIDKVNSG